MAEPTTICPRGHGRVITREEYGQNGNGEALIKVTELVCRTCGWQPTLNGYRTEPKVEDNGKWKKDRPTVELHFPVYFHSSMVSLEPWCGVRAWIIHVSIGKWGGTKYHIESVHGLNEFFEEAPISVRHHEKATRMVGKALVKVLLEQGINPLKVLGFSTSFHLRIRHIETTVEELTNSNDATD